MRIGERIKQRRLELGYTADALAKLLNKNRATIYRYENGDIENMPIDVLEPLAKALNTTPAYLMGWQEPHQPNESIISDQAEGYYVDPETAEFAEYLRTRPEMRILFSASRGISKEDMEETVKYIEAISSTGEDEGVHNIYIRKNMSIEDMRNEIRHELLHIINDDFHIDQHVNLIEHMVRRKELTDDMLETIDFYHHVL